MALIAAHLSAEVIPGVTVLRQVYNLLYPPPPPTHPLLYLLPPFSVPVPNKPYGFCGR